MEDIFLQNIGGVIEAVSAWALKVIAGIGILAAGILLARIVAGAARRAASGSLDQSLAEFLGKLAYYAIIAVVVITVCGVVGIETASLITVLGASSLAIGLALQGSLSNLASGVTLLVFRPYRAGDYVEIGDDAGWVVSVGVFSTELDTLDNIRVVLPNAHASERPIRNWSTNGTRRLELEIEISVDSAIPSAREAIAEMLSSEPRVLPEPHPVVATSDFGDTSAKLVVRPWCKPEDYWDLRFELPERIKDAIEGAGCSLPCPQRQIIVQSGNLAA
jgi:small conductance mechanosensitive channel